MRNCLILGSGRSGTSMVAGVLSAAGYYMGEHLWPSRSANPKGFFEDREVNRINEDLIATAIRPRPRGPLRPLFRSRPTRGQRWLASVPVDRVIAPSPILAERIARQVARAPFCFKDPRFCYTLPAWRAAVGDAVFVCVFRHPAPTVASILKECREVPHLRDLRVDARRAVKVWTLMYRHVLERHSRTGEWAFVHYDQVLDTSAAATIEPLLGVEGDWSFPDAGLRRSSSDLPVTAEARAVYEELCCRARY